MEIGEPLLHTVPTSASHAMRRGAVFLGDRPWADAGEGGEEVATGDLLVLAPWLIFSVGIAVIGYVLFSSRGKSNGHRRHGR
jgi:hypothetical protein